MHIRTLRMGTVLSAFSIALCATALAQQQPPESIKGGLVHVQGSKVALAYVRPGTNWTKYKTILLKKLVVPVNARNAAPQGADPGFGESYMLSDNDVAQLQDAFFHSMQNTLSGAGYTFVTTPQADTLIVAPEIQKIVLSAPIESSRMDFGGMGATLSQGGGSITMGAVLADGSTKVVIAEVLDRKYGSSLWGINNSVTNFAEARRAFDGWANDLKAKLQSG